MTADGSFVLNLVGLDGWRRRHMCVANMDHMVYRLICICIMGT